jgi:hypothetical protein
VLMWKALLIFITHMITSDTVMCKVLCNEIGQVVPTDSFELEKLRCFLSEGKSEIVVVELKLIQFSTALLISVVT